MPTALCTIRFTARSGVRFSAGAWLRHPSPRHARPRARAWRIAQRRDHGVPATARRRLPDCAQGRGHFRRARTAATSRRRRRSTPSSRRARPPRRFIYRRTRAACSRLRMARSSPGRRGATCCHTTSATVRRRSPIFRTRRGVAYWRAAPAASRFAISTTARPKDCRHCARRSPITSAVPARSHAPLSRSSSSTAHSRHSTWPRACSSIPATSC